MERLPGFRDFYPNPVPQADYTSFEARAYLFSQWRAVARRYGFAEYDAPPLEPVELYTTKSGQEILNQLYYFEDKGGREVALRPEMTPSLARLVAAHNRHYKRPLKWFSIPQLFRYERQQKGRLREHFQFNADLIGESSTAADAELLALLIDTLRTLGLGADDFVVRLSSRDAWDQFLDRRNIPAERHPEFYLIIDKIERASAEETDKQLKPFGTTLREVEAFIETSTPTEALQEVLTGLEERGLSDFVRLDYKVIRGLAYYTGIVFEAFDKKGAFRAIAGGGRYDNLIRLVSQDRVDLPALGFGMGDVVLLELLKDRGVMPALSPRIDAYCLIEEERLRPDSLRVIQAIRDQGISVDYPMTRLKSDKQFKRALEMGAGYTVKLEQNTESQELRARVRNLQSRQESLLSLEKVPEFLSNPEPETVPAS